MLPGAALLLPSVCWLQEGSQGAGASVLAADALGVLLVALGQQLLQHTSRHALGQAGAQGVGLTQQLLSLALVLGDLGRQRL